MKPFLLCALSLLALHYDARPAKADSTVMIGAKNDLCLDVVDGALQNGAQVQLWQCTGGNRNQVWTLGNGQIKASNGLCLDLTGGGGNGTKMQLWSCSGGPNQTWAFDGQAIRNQAKGLCLDVVDGKYANGVRIQAWACDYRSTGNQVFSYGPTAGGQGDAANQGANPSGYLQTAGTKIVDKGGREVRLRGTNIGGWLVTEGWMNGYTDASDKDPFRFSWETLDRRFGTQTAASLIKTWQDNFFTSRDLDVIQSAGLNVIRVPFGYRNLQTVDGQWNKNSSGNIDFSRLDWVVAEAAKRNIYTILDFHMWQGQQQNYDTISQNSDAGRGQQAQAAAVWTQVAKRFKGNAWVAGFDAINEPTGSYANMMQDALYKAIRAVDQDRIIFMESMSADPASLGWKQVSYSIHQYDMMGNDFGANQQAFWNRFHGDVQSFQRFNIPTYIGEFMFQDNGPTLGWALAQYNQQGLHWTNWTYKTVNMGAWGLCNLDWDKKVDVLHDSADRIRSVWQNLGDCSIEQPVLDAFRNATR
ncbi:hypothetical protein Q3G72_003436 [Acer saccharum]|nr:hypothetical protein Q3G72_003436 [Acer saccharum]